MPMLGSIIQTYGSFFHGRITKVTADKATGEYRVHLKDTRGAKLHGSFDVRLFPGKPGLNHDLDAKSLKRGATFDGFVDYARINTKTHTIVPQVGGYQAVNVTITN